MNFLTETLNDDQQMMAPGSVTMGRSAPSLDSLWLFTPSFDAFFEAKPTNMEPTAAVNVAEAPVCEATRQRPPPVGNGFASWALPASAGGGFVALGGCGGNPGDACSTSASVFSANGALPAPAQVSSMVYTQDTLV